MLPLSKDNLCIVGIIVCVIGIFYLYREMLKLKKMTVARPSQPVPFPERVQPPVHDTLVQVPPPPVPVVVPQPPSEDGIKSE